MRLSIATIFAFMGLQAAAQYLDQSAPFHLVLKSENKTLNGKSLDACHEGAAVEGLCLGSKVSSASPVYTFNTSATDTPYKNLGKRGTLNFELRGGNFNLSSPLQISADITTNVAVPLFQPADYGTAIGFDKSNKMFVWGSIDDTVTPPTYKTQAIYKWYVCLTQYGYLYTTLTWVVGPHSPQNPTCVKVDVERVFA